MEKQTTGVYFNIGTNEDTSPDEILKQQQEGIIDLLNKNPKGADLVALFEKGEPFSFDTDGNEDCMILFEQLTMVSKTTEGKTIISNEWFSFGGKLWKFSVRGNTIECKPAVLSQALLDRIAQ